MTQSRLRALRFLMLLGVLVISYQNCSSGVQFQAGSELIGSTTATGDEPPGDPNPGPVDVPPVGEGPAIPIIPGEAGGPNCPTGRVAVGGVCLCPAGSNDIGNSCLTCGPNEVFNPMTLKCEYRSATVCPAGETYDGYKCVAISPTCDSYVEVASSNFVIPPRSVNADGRGKVCYYAKLVGKTALAPSTTYTERRQDIVSRNHGGPGNAAPHVMGSREIKFVLLGDREVVLAGDSHGGDDIYVDNYFLVEVMFPGLMKPNLWASGTGDAIPYRDGGGTMPIQVNGEPVLDWHVFGSGGTSRFNPINMYGQLTKNKEISFRGSSLDCGSVGETSDVYLLFR